MGNLCGGEENKQQQKAREKSDAISTDLRALARNQQYEVKLLLLGAGESGKSTIAKQMKVLHLNGFSNVERLAYRPLIYANAVSSMRTLITACHNLEIPLKHHGAAKRVKMPGDVDGTTGELSEAMANDMKKLWKDEGIQLALTRASEYQLIDSAAYYLSQLDTITAPGYVPSDADILRCRAKTTGIIEIDFTVERNTFRLVDVGGQRSERKKWMHCFQDVTSVLFCVALSEYDLRLYEDDSTNRMHESLKLFKDICNSKWFSNTSMMLFLNKRDLFQEKIARVPLTVCFPDCNVKPQDFFLTLEYIRCQFLSLNQNVNRQIYTHATVATDTKNISVVWNITRDIILREALRWSGLLL